MFNKTTNRTSFPKETVDAVWEKGAKIPGEDPNVYRKDTCGAKMQRSKYGEETTLGWEIDHIKPVSKGGGDELSNLQPLQWENNRHKGDDYPKWECKNKS